MKFENQIFDQERALYGLKNFEVLNCKFDGPADGESAFKECSDISVADTYLNLRYPFWHDDNLTISNCNMTENCRAALWYSKNILIRNSALHGIKALRECSAAKIENCEIVSPEFGWFSKIVEVSDSKAESEYFFMRAEKLHFKNVIFKGKYSFQYIKDCVFENCIFDTKDAFWHGENILVKNCIVRGEYLAWYSDGLTFENCKIAGTQPFCYCKNLKLVDCTMDAESAGLTPGFPNDCDLSFEKSEVEAVVLGKIESVKNPLSGTIRCSGVNEIIMDDPESQGKILLN